jgi:hypothetical protein
MPLKEQEPKLNERSPNPERLGAAIDAGHDAKGGRS